MREICVVVGIILVGNLSADLYKREVVERDPRGRRLSMRWGLGESMVGGLEDALTPEIRHQQMRLLRDQAEAGKDESVIAYWVNLSQQAGPEAFRHSVR